jgi:hypothetical protein
MKAFWRIAIALAAATVFVREPAPSDGRARPCPTRCTNGDEHDDTDLGDDFVYDVTARFNEALIANIDATDNALMAILAGSVALGVFAIDKIRELAPESERIVLALLGASAFSCLIAYTMPLPLFRAFRTQDGIHPKYFIPDFTDDPQGAMMRAVKQLMRSGEDNLAIRRAKKIGAVLAILLLLAGAGMLTMARVRGNVVS